MEMNVVNLEDISQLHNYFRAYRSYDGLGSWFRGQSNEEWKLLPKAGREFYSPNNGDLKRFNYWCEQAFAYTNLPKNKFEALAIAQHHGFATRMLDWTMNPLVACYFACMGNDDKNGAVYILDAPDLYITQDHDLTVLEEYQGIIGYIPRLTIPRMLNQKALFTIHCDSRKEIEVKKSIIGDNNPTLTKLIISSELKHELIKTLNDYGVNHVALFPDLDGLSFHLNADTLIKKKWKKT